jgi:hypothetical protein
MCWCGCANVLCERVRAADGRDPQPLASVQDRPGARLVLAGVKRRFPLLKLVWVDGGYVEKEAARRLAESEPARPPAATDTREISTCVK